MRGLRMQNDVISLTVLIDKGADILELTYRPKGIDVLWKSPWGLPAGAGPLPTCASAQTWLDAYPGGWQTIFPNGGDACTVEGVEYTFHGEAALAAWTLESLRTDDTSCHARLATRLRRSPFRITKELILTAGSPALLIRERITNEGGDPMPYMWSQHPAFGAPFLSGDCRIDTGATSVTADDLRDGPGNPLRPGRTYVWPPAIEGQDLSLVPAEGSGRALLGYLGGFEAGWFAITNTRLGFGVALTWPSDALPYAWMWQEMHASPGYP